MKKLLFNKTGFLNLICSIFFLLLAVNVSWGQNTISLTTTTAGVTTWTCPASVTSVQVEAWGGGGGAGGAGSSTNLYVGGGGAGGNYVKNTAVTVVPGTTYLVLTGAGGAGGLQSNITGNGFSGGMSFLINPALNSTPLIAALGGTGGIGGQTNPKAGPGGANGASLKQLSYTITNAGSGYTSAPTVTLSKPAAVAVAAYTLGSQISNGNNYWTCTTAGTTTSTTGPTALNGTYTNGTAIFTYTGVLATATAVLTNGSVSAVIIKQGSGYDTGFVPTASFSGGGGTGAAITLSAISNTGYSGSFNYLGGNGGLGFQVNKVYTNNSGAGGNSAGTASNGNNSTTATSATLGSAIGASVTGNGLGGSAVSGVSYTSANPGPEAAVGKAGNAGSIPGGGGGGPVGPNFDGAVGAIGKVVITILDRTPPANPGALTVSSVAATSLGLTWGTSADATNADFTGYLLVRYASAPATDNDPVQNMTYTVGSTFSSGATPLTGTVVSIGTITNFSDTGLTTGTQYYYKVYSFDSNRNYSTESSVSETPISTVDTTPPGNPGAASVANQTTSSLTVNWLPATNGTEAGGYLVVRYTGTPETDSNPVQGAVYDLVTNKTIATGTATTPKTGTVVYVGNNLTLNQTGLVSEKNYYYRIFTFDAAYNYSAASTVTGKTSVQLTAPVALAGTTVSATGFTANWQAVSASATGYSPTGYTATVYSLGTESTVVGWTFPTAVADAASITADQTTTNTTTNQLTQNSGGTIITTGIAGNPGTAARGATYYSTVTSTLTSGTIGTVSGSGPYTATISGISSTSALGAGQSLTATAGTGSFGLGTMTIASIVDATSITVSSTDTFTSGVVSNIIVTKIKSAPDKYWQIEANTTGFKNVKISSQQYSDGGPRDFTVQYSSTGASGTFTNLKTVTLAAATWNTEVTDIALPVECDNNPNVVLRWAQSSFYNTAGAEMTTSSGTSRIDNILVKGQKLTSEATANASGASASSVAITGLTKGGTYYYDVVANGTNTTNNGLLTSYASSAKSNLISYLFLIPQTNADYRSTGTGVVSLSSAANWEYNNGTAWLTATAAPTSASSITISSGNVLTLGANLTVATGKTLTVNGTLDLAGYVVSGAGATVTSNSGSTIILGNNVSLASGITATRSLNTATNFDFNGTTVAQHTGGLPGSTLSTSSANGSQNYTTTLTGNITVSNPLGVTMNQAIKLNIPGILRVKNTGKLSFGDGNVASETISADTYNAGSFSIASNSTGSFYAESGCTLVITASKGISGAADGNIRTATRTFESGINFIFAKNDGFNPISIGTSFYNGDINPATGIKNMTINNPYGVYFASTYTGTDNTNASGFVTTLSYTGGNDITVNGELNFVSGKLYTGDYVTVATNSVPAVVINAKSYYPVVSLVTTTGNTSTLKLNVGASGSITGAGSGTGWVVGNLKKATTAGNSPSYTYPIGDATTYSPVTVTFSGNTSADGGLTVRSSAGFLSNIADSGIDVIKKVNRYWSLTNSNLVGFGTYQATFNYATSENDASTTASNYEARRYDNASWSTATISGTPTTTATSVSELSGFGDFIIGQSNNEAPIAAAQSFCGGATVADLEPAAGTSYKWYTESTGGTALTSATALTSGTYYVSRSFSGVSETARTAVAITVNANATARVVKVSTIAALQTAINTANCGDIFILATGNYTNTVLNVNSSNITIKAANDGTGVFLNGTNDINIKGNYVKFSGFQFTSGDIGANNVIDVDGSHNTLSQLNFSGYAAAKYIDIGANTQYNTIEYCNISKPADSNPLEVGCALHIHAYSAKPGYHKVRYCSFQNFGGTGGDYGNEPIRIGLSTENYISRTIVENCYFNNTGLGDSESISIKSHENTVRFCTFTEQQNAMLVFRNGDNNVAYSNFFINAGGIRVKEANNIYCYNNYFQNSGTATTGSNIAGAVTYLYDPTTAYPYVLKNVNFVHNTFYDCGKIDFSSWVAIGNTWANNIFKKASGNIFEQANSGITFVGNMYQGTPNITIASGMSNINPSLALNSDGYYGLSAGSPAIDAASSSYPALLHITDIDDDANLLYDVSGQARPSQAAKKDVGCDEFTTGTITNRPLVLTNVGPAYLSGPATAAPTASSQAFCTSGTVANLVATGKGILWYAAATGGDVLTSTAALSTGTYYATQTLNGAESARTAVAVTIQAAPNAGTNGTLTVCAGTTPTNAALFAKLGGSPNTGGSWSNVGLVYTYTVSATSPCTTAATATVTVTEQALPNAGTNGTLTVCAGTIPTDAALFARLGGSPSAGGSWSNLGLVYTYTVSATAPCSTAATATVTVTEQAAPNAGTNGTLTICAGTTPSNSQLFARLGGSPSAGGSWSNVGLVYTYTVSATSPCTTAATATVTVTEQALPASAGTSASLVICAGTSVSESSLYAALGAPASGGTWSATSGGSGTYTYTQAATSPCTTPNIATVTVTEQAVPASAGTSASLVICAGTSVSESSLYAALGAPASGGKWSATRGGAGTYTYTQAATSPCTTANTATVTVTEQALPNAGTDGTLNVATGVIPTTSQLFGVLTGADANGSWTNSGLVYTYTVAATSPCTVSDTATVTVLEVIPNAFIVCSGTKISALVGTSSLKFYAALTGVAPAVAGTTELKATTTYFVTQLVGGVESTPRKSVVVTVNALPATPSALVLTNEAISSTAAVTAVGLYAGTNTAFKLTATAAGATSYKWILPSGVVRTDVTGTTIDASTTSTDGFIYVKFTEKGVATPLVINVQSVNANGCTSLSKASAPLTRLLPLAPAALAMNNGLNTAAITSFAKYMGFDTVLRLSATAAPTAASYVWELPTGVNRVTALEGGSITTDLTSTVPFIYVNFKGVTKDNTDTNLAVTATLTKVLRIGVKSVNGVGVSTTANSGLSSTAKLLTLSAIAPAAPTALVLNDGTLATGITVISKFIGQGGTYRLAAAVPATTVATSFAWELPSCVTRVAGLTDATPVSGTTSDPFIFVKFSVANADAGSIYFGVKAVNGVGSSNSSAANTEALAPGKAGSEFKLLKLVTAAPAAPATLVLNDLASTTPATAVAVVSKYIGFSTKLRLTAAASVLANTYSWELPTGVNRVDESGNILQGRSTSESFIFVTFENVSALTTPISLVFGVKAVNSVGSSVTANTGATISRTDKLLTVTAGLPAVVAAVSGSLSVCNRPEGFSYTITAPVGATSYIITAPVGSVVSSANGVSGATPNVLTTSDLTFKVVYAGTAPFSTTDKNLIVRSSNAFGPCLTTKSIALTKQTTCTGLVSTARLAAASENDNFDVIANPNPSSDVFTLEVQSSGKGKATTKVQVYDMTGRLIEQRQVESNSVEIGNNYPTGVYNVIVNQGENTKTLRVIKK